MKMVQFVHWGRRLIPVLIRLFFAAFAGRLRRVRCPVGFFCIIRAQALKYWFFFSFFRCSFFFSACCQSGFSVRCARVANSEIHIFLRCAREKYLSKNQSDLAVSVAVLFPFLCATKTACKWIAFHVVIMRFSFCLSSFFLLCSFRLYGARC